MFRRAQHHIAFINKGFTLIELVIVIVLLSALGIMTTTYISTGVDIYTDTTERDESLNSVRFVMERLRREVANALPNSAVVESAGQCLTFKPIIASSIYGGDFPIFPLNASSGGIAPINIDMSNAQAVVYLLSASELTSSKVQAIGDYSAGQPIVTFSGSISFPLSSPAKRVYFINDTVTYCFSADNLYRRINSGGDQLMAENVTGSFQVSDATLQRNGLVLTTFIMNFDGQSASVTQTLPINNVP